MTVVAGWRGRTPGRVVLDDAGGFVRFEPDQPAVRYQRRAALFGVVRRAREHVAIHGWWVLGR